MTANCAPNLPHVNVRGVRRQPDQRYKHETAHGSVCRAPVPSPAGNRVGGDEELHQLRSAAPGMGGSGSDRFAALARPGARSHAVCPPPLAARSGHLGAQARAINLACDAQRATARSLSIPRRFRAVPAPVSNLRMGPFSLLMDGS